MAATWQTSILAALVHFLLLSYMVDIPAARILFTTWPKKEPEPYVTYYHDICFGYSILKEMVNMITKFKSIKKKSEILNAGYGLMQYYPLLSPCSHSGAQAKERNFTIFTQTIMKLVYLTSPHPPTPPKFCITVIFNFSLDDCNTREKLETMVLQSFGGNKGGLWS